MLSIEDKFLTLNDAKKMIQSAIVTEGLSYTVLKSNSKRHIVICKEANCSLRIQFSKLKDTYRITNLSNCSSLTHRNF